MPEPVSLSHENGFVVQRRGFRPAQLGQTPWPVARECHGTGGQHEGSRAGRPFAPSIKINTSATDSKARRGSGSAKLSMLSAAGPSDEGSGPLAHAMEQTIGIFIYGSHQAKKGGLDLLTGKLAFARK